MKHTARKIVLLCCILALCLTGCAASQSTVRGVQLSDREQKIAALGDYTVGVLEFSFQQDVQGFLWQREIWKYGELVEANIAAYGGTDTLEALYIAHKQGKNDDGSPEITWEMLKAEKNGYSKGSPAIQVAFPECKDKEFGWASGFWGQDNTKSMALEAGKSYILSAETMDLMGDGWMGIPCGEYTAQEQFIKDSDCVILLRMDTFATAEEAEQEAETREQENRAKIGARL